MEALDELAVALRARLIERARAGESGGGGLEAEVRALVEREAASLPGDEREALAGGWCCWRPGSGRSSRCSPIRRSTR